MTYRALIHKAHIGFLNSIIESYEGFAVVRTVDASSGVVELWISPPFEDRVLAIMDDLAAEIGLQSLQKVPYRIAR